MSTIETAPISYFVYSALSFFGSRHDGELPGSWFVRALAAAGRDAAAVRQTLYRMEQDGELSARRSGRMKFYRATSYARAEIDAGSAKIFQRRPADWDGRWTVVRVGLRTPAGAKQRERVIALLAVEGFAQLDANVFVHPRPVGDRLYGALPVRARAEVVIVRGELLGDEAQQAMVKLWRVSELAQRYRRLLGRLAALERRVADGVTDRAAFLARFSVVFEYLGVAWDDPDLPAALLPADWPGEAARRRAAALYEALLPGALRYAEEVLQDVLATTE